MQTSITKNDLTALVAAIEANGHSVFAPSAAHRWMRCHASIRDTLLAAAARSLSLDDEDEGHDGGSSFFSVEGTAAHHLAEVWMKKGRRAARRLHGKTFKRDGIEITFDDEMFTEVERYVDWCDDLSALTFGKPFTAVETRVTFGKMFPIENQGGTCDHIYAEWLPDGSIHLIITDLKYGKGVRVFAERNPQGMLYAIGALYHLIDLFGVDNVLIDRVTIRIGQPRLDHFDVWTCSHVELMEFGLEVAEAARACWSDNPRYDPDPKTCRFCPVRASCNALKAEAQAMADQAFGHEDGEQAELIRAEIPTGLMTIEQKEEALRWRATFQSWFRRLQEDLFREADAGAELEHFKITDGRTKRGWKSKTPSETAEWLEFLGLEDDQIWVKTLVSPAQAELVARAKKVASKKAIGAEVTSVAGPRTLAPVIDPRSALAGSADVFEPVPEDDVDLS